MAAYKPVEPKPPQQRPESPKPTVYRDKREAMEALKELLRVSTELVRGGGYTCSLPDFDFSPMTFYVYFYPGFL